MTGPANNGFVRAQVRPDALAGTIIDAGPDSVLGAVPVDLADSVQVWVDPLDPARLVRANCADVSESGWLLDELLGPGAASTIAAAQSGTGDGTVLLRPTAVARDAHRAGLLLWLEDASPLPLNQGLLDAELAAAFHALPGEPAAAEARRRGRAALPAALTLAAVLADGSTHPHPQVARTAFRVAGALLATASPSDNEVTALVRLATSARSASTAATEYGHLEANLMRLFESSAVAAIWEAALAPVDDQYEVRFSVDWRVVPRGVLDPSEGAIHVTWRTGDTGVLVTVAAQPGAPDQPLFARILPTDEAAPIPLTPLRFDPEAHLYHARFETTSLTSGDRVDVFSAAASVTPLRGPQAEKQAAGLRFAGRALAAMRLATATPSPERLVLWRSAANEWMEWLAEIDERTDRDADVVHGALARCQRQLGLPLARLTAARRRDPDTEPSWADPCAALSLAEARLLSLG